MPDFIFETEILNVKNNTVKGYLAEVLSSYELGNYRSAIVSLCNVVLCDFVFKLKTLKEVYDDTVATEILSQLNVQNNTDMRYGEWERDLIAGAKKARLIDTQDEKLIQRLREDRDQCAHVALKDYSLYSPNRDQVRAHIRNMFEIVFLRDTILHKEIVNTILEDIEYYQNIVGVIDPDRFEHFLTMKYYSKLNEKAEKELFKTLWKITYVKIDERCNRNRRAGHLALVSLVKRNESKFLAYVKNDPTAYYGRIHLNPSGISLSSLHYEELTNISIKEVSSPQAYLIYFFSQFPTFFHVIGSNLRDVIFHEAEKNINLLARTSFISEKDLSEHLEGIWSFKNKIMQELEGKYNIFTALWISDVSLHKEQVIFLLEEARYRNSILDYVAFILKWVRNISSYDSTEYVILNLVLPSLIVFSKENVIQLLTNMNENSQFRDETKTNHNYLPRLKEQIENQFGLEFIPEDLKRVFKGYL